MPTYSYACTECDNKFDAVQSFTDDSMTECPRCDGRLRKLFGKVGVVFKGSGFYRNDSREAAKNSESRSSDAGTDSSSASSSDSASAGSSDKSSSPDKSSSSDKSSSPDKSSSSEKSSSSSTSAAAPSN
ncbi:MAG: FmdB family zinc ribbon protein [Mycobacterium sp.]